MALKDKLEDDREDEDEAITLYGKRKRQTKGAGLSPMYNEMQDDEKDHKRKLSKALAGLRSAK